MSAVHSWPCCCGRAVDLPVCSSNCVNKSSTHRCLGLLSVPILSARSSFGPVVVAYVESKQTAIPASHLSKPCQYACKWRAPIFWTHKSSLAFLGVSRHSKSFSRCSLRRMGDRSPLFAKVVKQPSPALLMRHSSCTTFCCVGRMTMREDRSNKTD